MSTKTKCMTMMMMMMISDNVSAVSHLGLPPVLARDEMSLQFVK